MDRYEAIEQLQELAGNDDTEVAHGRADQILCDLLSYLGFDDVVEAYEQVDKWYA